MKSHLKMYFTAFKNTLASRMAYRVDFYISVFIMLVSELIIPFTTFLIYQSGASFPGWEFHEVFMIQAVFLLAKGITFPFFSGIVFTTILLVREGTYDLILIKPRNTLFMTLLSAIDVEDLGKSAGGIGLFVIALIRMPPTTSLHWLAFALLFICTLIVFVSFALLMAASGFKWVGNFRVYEIFDSITSFGMYPQSIFSKGTRILISSIIPLSIMGFLPAAALLGKPLHGLLFSLIAVSVLFSFSIFFWYRMLRSYASAGG